MEVGSGARMPGVVVPCRASVGTQVEDRIWRYSCLWGKLMPVHHLQSHLFPREEGCPPSSHRWPILGSSSWRVGIGDVVHRMI
jgi:hypothetical protein